ncbi:MAG: protein kinase [Anaerolineae bacterium]|nr:protein kinase [Anaerolineae bacterium]
MAKLFHGVKRMKLNAYTNEHPNFNQIAEIARTDFSQILLAVELQTRELAILKVANHDKNTQGGSLSTKERENNNSIKNEVEVIGTIIKQAGPHFRLPKLLAVQSNGTYLAVAKSTRSNYLAEPYYAGMPLSDLINNRGYFSEQFIYRVRRINLSLLRFFCRSNILPKSYNMLRWLGIPDRLVRPPGKIISGKPIPVQQAILYIDQIASGLEHLHTSAGHYVHLDLKPNNILLKNLTSPEIVIIDLGEARPQGEPATLGNQWWRAPEQVKIVTSDNRQINESRAHPAMDIYSLGLIFGYLLTGIIPGKLGSRKYSDLVSTFIYPAGTSEEQRKKLNDRIKVLLDSCLAENPCLRPSAKDVRAELNQIKKLLPQQKGRNRGFVLRPLLAIILLFIFCYGIWFGFLQSAPTFSTPASTTVAIAPTNTPTPTVSPAATSTRMVTPKPTATPTSTASVVPLTASPTPATPTVTRIPTSIPTPTPIPNVSIKILNPADAIIQPNDKGSVQSCNSDINTFPLNNNPLQFAFTVNGNLFNNDVLELQIDVSNEIVILIDSSKFEDINQGTNLYSKENEQGRYYYFEERFTPDHLIGWGNANGTVVRRGEIYKWRVVIKRYERIIGESHEVCQFKFG